VLVAVSVAIICLNLLNQWVVADTIELFVVAPAAVGGLWLVAWLLVKGAPVPAPAPRAQALTG
jgi:hypothetical protein